MKSLLPAALKAFFDAIVSGFVAYWKGRRDEAALRELGEKDAAVRTDAAIQEIADEHAKDNLRHRDALSIGKRLQREGNANAGDGSNQS